MATIFINLPTIASNGAGAAADVSGLAGLKTIVNGGNGYVFEPFVSIEISCDGAGTNWAPLHTFQGNQNDVTLPVAAHWMRAVVANYKGGGAPQVDVGADGATASFATLVAPATDGVGAGVATDTLPSFKTVQVATEFRGTVGIQVSEDAGASWSTVMSFTAPGQQVGEFTADQMRAIRTGVPGINPGLPLVRVGAVALVGGGSGPDVDAVIFDDAVPGANVNIRSDRAANQSPIDNTKAQITNLGSQDHLVDPAATGATGVGSTIGGGNDNSASGDGSTIPGGVANIASGADSYAEGHGCQATGPQSHAEGALTHASGPASGGDGELGAFGGAHAEGFNTVASGVHSHAEGTSTTAQGNASHAEGAQTTASNDHSHAEGGSTHASGLNSHAEGDSTTASGSNSHAEGNGATASGDVSHAEGLATTAIGDTSHAEGSATTASGPQSHAEGDHTVASGIDSHAEGSITTASGAQSHAEGLLSQATGQQCHAEGFQCTASGFAASHAEGQQCAASGIGAHAEGWLSAASGDASHAEGLDTIASALASHAQGIFSRASRDGQDALASSAFVGGAAGDAQTSVLTFIGSTPGIAPAETVELVSGSPLVAGLVLEDNKSYLIRVSVSAGGVQAGPTRVMRAFTSDFCVRRAASVSVIAGVLSGVAGGDGAAAPWTFAASIGAGPDRVAFTFTTGTVTSACKVIAKVEFTEVLF